MISEWATPEDDVEPVAFTAVCLLPCDWQEPWSEREHAEHAAVWHIHDTHPDWWKRVIGDRPPTAPRPRRADRG